MTKGHITVAVNMEIIPIEMDFTHTRGEQSRPVAGALRYRNRQHGRAWERWLAPILITTKMRETRVRNCQTLASIARQSMHDPQRTLSRAWTTRRGPSLASKKKRGRNSPPTQRKKTLTTFKSLEEGALTPSSSSLSSIRCSVVLPRFSGQPCQSEPAFGQASQFHYRPSRAKKRWRLRSGRKSKKSIKMPLWLISFLLKFKSFGNIALWNILLWILVIHIIHIFSFF